VGLEDQVISRVIKLIKVGAVGDVWPAKRAAVRITTYHDHGVHVDLADRIDRKLGRILPVVTAHVVGLIHDIVSPDAVAVLEVFGQLPPDIGIGGTGNLRRADDVAGIVGVGSGAFSIPDMIPTEIMHVGDDQHASLFGQIEKGVKPRHFGAEKRIEKLSLNTLPAESETDQLHAAGLVIVEVFGRGPPVVGVQGPGVNASKGGGSKVNAEHPRIIFRFCRNYVDNFCGGYLRGGTGAECSNCCQ